MDDAVEKELADELGGGGWDLLTVHAMIRNAPNGAFARAWHALVFRERYIKAMAGFAPGVPADAKLKLALWNLYNDYRIARGMPPRPPPV